MRKKFALIWIIRDHLTFTLPYTLENTWTKANATCILSKRRALKRWGKLSFLSLSRLSSRQPWIVFVCPSSSSSSLPLVLRSMPIGSSSRIQTSSKPSEPLLLSLPIHSPAKLEGTSNQRSEGSRPDGTRSTTRGSFRVLEPSRLSKKLKASRVGWIISVSTSHKAFDIYAFI